MQEDKPALLRCHDKFSAETFNQKAQHRAAWIELDQPRKQFSHKCVNCLYHFKMRHAKQSSLLA